MSVADVSFLSITQILALLDRHEISALELVENQLGRIERLDGQLNAFITVLAAQARTAAVEADRRRQQGETGALLGVPLAVKDLFATSGIRTTAGSRVRANNIPSETATVVHRLEAAGAILLGKTNMMEFAYGYPHPDFGETRNPWATDRTAGGSSGGSAAAVAAGIAFGALGTDTGGSIRSPAAYCGVTGLKPTYGRVSRSGVVPLSWSLDHVGPLTRTVRDAALMYDAIAGYDPHDPASSGIANPATSDTLNGDISGCKIGVVDILFQRHVTDDVRPVALAALDDLRSLGAELVQIELPCAEMVCPTIMPIIQSEATNYHWSTLQTRPEEYSHATLENLRLGATILAKDYLQAQRMRRAITVEVSSKLNEMDVLVFPTQPIVAPFLDAYHLAEGASDDVLDVEIGHTGLANLTGHPAISVPCGFTDAGLPVGLQFTGQLYAEQRLLQISHMYEQSTVWHRHWASATAGTLSNNGQS